MKVGATKRESTATDHATTAAQGDMKSDTSSTIALNADISSHQLNGAPQLPGATISHIARLPPELHLRILAKVPARDIQKCRRLDRYFRSLIDNKENHSLCTGPSVSRSLERLQAQILDLSDFPLDTFDENGMPTAFLSALGKFLSHHGLCPLEDNERFVGTIGYFALHWMHRRLNIDNYGPGPTAEQSSMLQSFIEFCTTLVEHHISVHVKEAGASDGDIFVLMARFAFLCTPANLQTIGVTTKEQRDNFVERLVDERPFSSATFSKQYSPRQQSGHSLLYILPKAPLVSKLTVIPGLSKLLDVPELRWTTPTAWFVSSQWAFDELKSTTEKDVLFDHVKKAALLEDMFLDWDSEIADIDDFPDEDATDTL